MSVHTVEQQVSCDTESSWLLKPVFQMGVPRL